MLSKINLKRIIAFVLVLITFSAAFAQNEEKKSREQMRRDLEEFKMKFIAQEIELKEDQKDRFMALYAKMSNEKMQAFSKAMKMERDLRRAKGATDAEYAAASAAMTEAKTKDAEIDKKYEGQFGSFLSNKQIFLMKGAEEKFRRKMEAMRGKKTVSSKRERSRDKGSDKNEK